jgi:hypothetical protein
MASRIDPIESQFFSQRNKELLKRTLTDDFQRRGVQFNGTQLQRVDNTLQHYMEEVYEVNGSQPIVFLNKEVIGVTVVDLASYLRRNEAPSVNIAQTVAPALPGAAAQQPRQLTDDTNSAYERLQAERQNSGRPMPKNIPDFRVSLDDDNESPLAAFEMVQKQRESEAALVASATSAKNGNIAMNRFINATDNFALGFQKQADNVEQTLIERSANRVVNGLPSFPLAGQTAEQQLQPRQPNANFTTSLPEAVRTRETLPQDFIIKQQDVLSYKEQEYNLFINSGDRDWVNNTTDTRYEFTVNFNPANNRQGFGLSPAAQVRFKNISRIELVKSIIPAEGLDVLVRKKASGTTDTANSDVIVNALSFPYISVRVAELDNNNYGTNNTIDNTFGVLQYDANWISESVDIRNDLQLSRGYLAMIPKFMKCQKVYAPTPLASLQKMTIMFQRPDGTALSSVGDALSVAGIIPSEELATGTSIFGATVTNTNAVYTTTSGADSEYYWIVTSTWFPRHLFNEGDRINIGGLNLQSLVGTITTGSVTITQGAVDDMTSYFTQSGGLLVSSVGFYNGSTFQSGGYISSGVTTCANSAGYANCIIVRARYADPTTGLTTVSPFGGTTAVNVALGRALVGTTTTPSATNVLFPLTGARLINKNHQTQLVFRVITRELDPTSGIRPDNI